MIRLAKTIKSAVHIALTGAAIFGGVALISACATSPDAPALELAWTYETGKPINYAPIVAGDHVLTVPNNGGPLIALNATSGQVAWQYRPGDGVWDRGFASAGDQVFVCLKGAKIAALDVQNGKELWVADLNGINCQRGAYIDGDTVYVSTTFVGPELPGSPLTGATLFALDRTDGSVKWTFKADTFLLQTATTYGDTVYIGGSYKDPDYPREEGGPARYYALDAKSGSMKWVYESIDGIPKALYATEDKLLFVAYEDFIQALDAKSGEFLWKRNTGNWVPSMVGVGNVVYFGSANTFVHAWSAETGDAQWRYNIPGAAFDYLLIKPVLSDGRLYFMSQRGTVYALDPKTGKQILSFATGMDARVGVSIGQGYAYMGDSKGRIYGYKILK